ncbi:IS3 family transposase [Bradyrhizobium sp. CCBAU 51765]|nr:IS3 family transposase [Bradyrhizobium sp. CCBAU 51765]
MCRARGLAGRLLRLARAPRERPCNLQFCAAGRYPAGQSRKCRALRQSPDPRCPADAGTWGQPRPDRTADASAWYSRDRGAVSSGSYHRSRHNLPIAPNLIARDFTAAAPNRVWLADITYIPTAEGWLYLAAIMDLCSRKIAGWAMRDHMRVELVSSTLTMAIQQQRPRAGLIHHSDRGVQASHEYRAALAGADITASMSRKAGCFDNAPMESFFHTLKTELVHHRRYQTRAQAQRDIFFIEAFYNRTRLHSAIGYIAPIERELKPLKPVHFFGGRSKLTSALFNG